MPEVAPLALQVATSVGPVVAGVGQVTVVYPFAAEGDAGVQLATPVGPVVATSQVVVV